MNKLDERVEATKKWLEAVTEPETYYEVFGDGTWNCVASTKEPPTSIVIDDVAGSGGMASESEASSSAQEDDGIMRVRSPPPRL